MQTLEQADLCHRHHSNQNQTQQILAELLPDRAVRNLESQKAAVDVSALHKLNFEGKQMLKTSVEYCHGDDGVKLRSSYLQFKILLKRLFASLSLTI